MLFVMFLVYWTPLVLAVLVVVMIFAYRYWVRVLLIFVAIYILGIFAFSVVASHYHEKGSSINQQDKASVKPITQ